MSIANYLAPALLSLLTVTASLAIADPAAATALTQQDNLDPFHLLRSAQQFITQGEPFRAAQSLEQATDAAQQMADANQRDDVLRQISFTYLQLNDSATAIALSQSMSDVTLSSDSCCTPLRTQAEIAIATHLFNTQHDTELNQFLQTLPEGTRRNDVVLGTIRAGEDRGQFERASELLALISNPQEILSAQHTLIQRYGQAGAWSSGVALAQQIADSQERATAMYGLAQTATQAGQYSQALTLAQQIALPQSRITAIANLAIALSNVGDTRQAHQLMEQAYAESQSLDPRPQPYWVDQFAQVRAYDRAIAILNSLNDSYTQSEGRLFLARAYWNSDRLNDALELAEAIPDGQLQLHDGYPDPKVEFVIDSLTRAAELGQPDVIDRGLALLSPIRRVTALLHLSEIDTATAETRLEQALKVALTIDEMWLSPEQPFTNAGLLLTIAQRFADLGNAELAQASAQQALRALSTPPIDSIQTNHAIATLGSIARLGRSIDRLSLTQEAIARAQSLLVESTAQDPNWRVQTWLVLAQLCGALEVSDCATSSITQAQAIAQQHDLEVSLINTNLALGEMQHAQQELDEQLSLALASEEPQRSFNLWRQAVSLADATHPDLAFRVAAVIPDATARASAWAELTQHYAARNQATIAEQAFTSLLASIDQGWNPDERDRHLALSAQQLIQPTDEDLSNLQYELAARLLPAITSPQARASVGLAIAQAAFVGGAEAVAQSALASAVTASQQQPSLNWSTTLWETFQTALRYKDLTLAETIADQFDNPFYQINALRHLAHRYGRRGEIDPAIAALHKARQSARRISDLPTRDQYLRAIATHQHWLEQ